MISFVGPDSFYFTHYTVTRLLSMGSVACVVRQAVGAGLHSSDNVSPVLKNMFGRMMLLSGLINQLVLMSVFLLGAVLFDAAPMFLATLLFNFVHPPKYLPKQKGMRMDGSFEEPPAPVSHWWSKKAKSKAPSGHSSPSDNMTMSRV
jgi:hypothetical protein